MKRTILLLLLIVFSLTSVPKTNFKERSIFIILINSYDQVWAEGEIINTSKLKDAIKEFISNPDNNPDFAEKKEIYVPLLGNVMVSKGIVSIQCDRNATYQKYIDVQNEIERAFNELRYELAWVKFMKNYKHLDKEQKWAINRAVPKSISEAQPRNIFRRR